MTLFSMLVVASVVVAFSLALARLGLAFTLSVASHASQLQASELARESIH